MDLNRKPGYAKVALVLAASAALVVVFWQYIAPVLGIVAGGWAFAFLLEPLSRWLERFLSRPVSAALSLIIVVLFLALAFVLLFPPMIRQLMQLVEALPASIVSMRESLNGVNIWLTSKNLPALNLPSMDLSAVTGNMVDFFKGTAAFATNVAGAVSNLALMAVLSVFFLSDRDRILLRLELMIPSKSRRLFVRMGSAVKRDLRLYLRGQAMVSLAVGVLATIGLWFVGAPSPLVLGVFVGVLNLIPYFGPVIGAVPVLIACLALDFHTALFAGIVLIVVQQLDGMLISPRIMGNLTGFSPASVLVAVFFGAGVAGILGMLVALPIMMVLRTCVRVFVQRSENV